MIKNRINIFTRVFSLILATVLLVCGIPFVVTAATQENSNGDNNYRVLLSSDMHYSIDRYMGAYYGVTNDDRLQLWVDSIKKEHERLPINLLIIPGDVSFDHCDSRGTVTQAGQSTVDTFVERYVSQLPDEIDVFIMPGNHDAWTNANWVAKTGYNREGYLTLGDNLFIMIDTFDNPNSMEDNYGTGANMTYQQIDVAWVQSVMALYPTHDVWLVSHYFNYNSESRAFKNLVKNNDRVMGLFAGHTHQSELISLGADYGNKVIAQTGTFSYSYYTAYPNQGTEQDLLDCLWGYRELVITGATAYSQYILADTTGVTNLTSPAVKQERRTAHRVDYDKQSDWYDANADTLYVDSVGDLLAFSKSCNSQNSYLSGKTVRLKSDIDLAGYDWTQIEEFHGTLDGQGFAIKNLTMGGSGAVSFIKILNNATVENIRFIDGTVTSTENDIATIAIIAKGTCYFKNVYTKMRLNLGSSKYRASGMISYTNADGSKAVFENCVSECTVSGQRAGGFVAQVMVNSTVEMTDCAFIGDLSAAGQWSAGLTGLTTGSVTLTRCVSLGKESANAASGLLVFLDDQNARWQSGSRYNGAQNSYYNVDSVIQITDCFAASAERYPVGLENSSQVRREFFDFTVNYGMQRYHLDAKRLTANDAKSSLLNFSDANPSAIYLANGTNNSMAGENFATDYAVLANAGWRLIEGESVAYGDQPGMTIPLILPKEIAQMHDGSFRTPVSSRYWQTKKNGSDYDVRFVSTVNFDDLADYEKVGFEVSVKVKGEQTYLLDHKVLSTSTVLTSVLAGNDSVSASSLGVDYIYALQIRGFKADTEYEIVLVSFAETIDGTVIYNYENETTMTVKNGDAI